jgi:hypothetical protein
VSEPTPDQRRAARIEVDLPVRFRCVACSIDGRAHDLSASGVCFLTGGASADLNDVEAVGSNHDLGEVSIEIDLPDAADAPLSVVGQVRWEADGAIGIRFTNLSLAERRRLANFVILRSHRR